MQAALRLALVGKLKHASNDHLKPDQGHSLAKVSYLQRAVQRSRQSMERDGGLQVWKCVVACCFCSSLAADCEPWRGVRSQVLSSKIFM